MARLKDYFLPVQPDLPAQPCVVYVASRLKQHPSRIVGAMVMVWGLASQTGESQGDDVALDLDADAVDDLVGLPGFAATWAAWRPARPWFAVREGRAVCVSILKRIGGKTISQFEEARAEGLERHRERARSCARVARKRAQPERNFPATTPEVAPELRPSCAESGENGENGERDISPNPLSQPESGTGSATDAALPVLRRWFTAHRLTWRENDTPGFAAWVDGMASDAPIPHGGGLVPPWQLVGAAVQHHIDAGTAPKNWPYARRCLENTLAEWRTGPPTRAGGKATDEHPWKALLSGGGT